MTKNVKKINFITLNRKILDWQWYKVESRKCVFLHCLLRANFKDQYIGMKLIKRGSFPTSYEILSDEIGYSKNTIRKCLNDLQHTGEIKVKSTKKGTIVTVCNYSEYQDYGSTSDTLSDPLSDTIGEHGVIHRVNTINNVNNVNNENKNKVTSVIDYFCATLNKKVTHNQTNIKLISKVLKSYSVEECKTVIGFVKDTWLQDPFWSKKVRVPTIFAFSKFESYLDDANNYEPSNKEKLLNEFNELAKKEAPEW